MRGSDVVQKSVTVGNLQIKLTAAVQASISALHDEFSVSPAQLKDYRFTHVQKQKLSEEEKKRKIFETAYEPSLEWWTSDQEAYAKSKDDCLAAGYPEQITPASLWDGHELMNEPERWLYKFTPEDVDVLNNAYDHFISLSLPNQEIKQSTFPIPVENNLHKAFYKTSQEVKTGLGFRVLTGLPVDEGCRQKQIIIFAGISSYISDRRLKQGKQNIVHLRDLTNPEEDKRPAITVKGQTSGNQVFHNDGSAGIVGLITLGVAESGGLSQLSSVAQTYNELIKTRRDIVREFAKDDWRNKQYPEGKRLWFSHKGDIISNYSRRPYFGFYEAEANVPPFLDLDLEKGDLEYFNNHTVFHARTSSEDSEKNQRHLIRIWLDNKEEDLPEGLSEL
ncbi:hypothetical protein IAR55_004702 [Kwoniella newhampshirensis]|uniref:TauD/TfdA-like domain-containing protein n=1 Tax=Kwoniella newhampshirensis TaxID=1651941 RepID=A0AAW0YHX4_9TREE